MGEVFRREVNGLRFKIKNINSFYRIHKAESLASLTFLDRSYEIEVICAGLGGAEEFKEPIS